MGLDVGHETQVLGARLVLDQAGDLLQQFVQAHGLDIQRELATFNAGDVQRALDQGQQVVPSPLDDANGVLHMLGQLRVFIEQLGVAQDAVERGAQFVADGGDVAALGLVGLVGRLLGLLQLAVGDAVRSDFAYQQMGLAVGFLLRHLPALVREHQPPAHHAHDQQQGRKDLDEGRLQHGRGGHRRAQVERHHVAHLLLVDQAKDPCQQGREHQHDQEKLPQLGVHPTPDEGRHDGPPDVAPLLGPAGRRGLAQVLAAGVQRAAQGADEALVGRAMGHVIGLVLALAHGATVQGLDADHSAQGLPRVATGLVALPWRHRRFGRRGRLRRARQVIAALRGPRNQRRGREGHHHRQHGREGLGQLAQPSHVRHHRHQRRQAHRAHTHGVDVVQISALELDALG